MKHSTLFVVIALSVLNSAAQAQIHVPTVGMTPTPRVRPVVIYSPPLAPPPVIIYQPLSPAPSVVVPPPAPPHVVHPAHGPEQHCYKQQAVDSDGDGVPNEWIIIEVPCNQE